MADSNFVRRRQQLLDRFLAGDIDKATYSQMLGELDRLQKATAEPSVEGAPSLSDGRTQGAGPAEYQSIGEMPSVPVRASGLTEGVEIGGFRIESRLGRGGMGEVWKAYDRVGERTVVIKVLPAELQASADEMARVKQTFKRVHALQHEHICPVYLLGEDPEIGFFLVMKFLDGQNLSAHRRSYVEQHGSFPLKETVRLLAHVANALDYAHRHRVIHRDVKPQNIMVCGAGADAQVVDFGLAAEIRTSMSRVSQVRMETSGTYPYMAPEQWRGEYQDGRTDQYALAVVAYEMLSGCLPFEAPDSYLLRQVVLDELMPELPTQPERVNVALSKALAKDRNNRFATCIQFLKHLYGAGADARVKGVGRADPPQPVAPAAKATPDPASQRVGPADPGLVRDWVRRNVTTDPGNCLYLPDDLSRRQRRGLAKWFQPESGETLLLVFDNTVFKSCANGTVITDRRLVWKDLMEKTTSTPLASIRGAEALKDKLLVKTEAQQFRLDFNTERQAAAAYERILRAVTSATH